MSKKLIPLLCALVSQMAVLTAAERPAGLPDGYRLLYEQRFDTTNAWADFAFSDVAAWKLAFTNQGGALELAQQSKYKPAVRSPVNIALIADRVFGDFTIDVELKQTGREYGHRDMCLFFNFVDPSHFYYAHLATAADDHAHNVFIVDGTPRTKIAEKTTQGVNWGLNVAHKVRLERRAADGGSIKVYFDDFSAPIMVAANSKFTEGYLGFGSFDDTGTIDNIQVWGLKMETKKGNPFTPVP
jgi:hypothetical protein